MGITINDAVEIKEFGLSLTGLTATIKGNYTINKKTINNVTTYVVTANVFYTKGNVANPIMVNQVSIEITPDKLASNLFSLLYAKLKSLYKSTVDV